ncbi:helix-turn-helix domain-containing protein [Paenibacillus sp. GCM10012307]|uniref:XRE family transcriptional regulator n=1 Tax=Paenibacillus roseus TaxID=2798579 RepID=A0A934J5S5_9BACL|nr:XRE family transcriptional regulator [Paenibacillus roseus]MBJ6360920.1 XRE family transcriptional regulator [Paenibacillus roseus]
MTVTRTFNGDRLKAARIYRGKTIAELAEEVEVTKQAISQFENGKTPGLETLLRLISALGFPRDYFYEQNRNEAQIGNTYFRALLTSKKKDRMSQIEKMKIVASIYHFLNKYVNFPNLNLPSDSYDFNDIESIASQLRQFWGIGVDEPLTNMVRLLEKNGIIVTSFSTDGEGIDAFSQRQQVEGCDYYFVVLGEDKRSATRRQFDAAHELGHIILHDWTHDIESLSREEFRQVENEANQFAASFLLPKDAFIRDLIYPNKLDYYVELKKKWRVSVSAMIVRAYQLKVINNNQYQNLMKQLSKKGWRTKEPLDDVIQIPKPTLMKKAIEILIINQVMTGEQIVRQLSTNNLSLNSSEIEVLLGLDKGTLVDKNQGNPVVSIRQSIGREIE